MNRPSLTAEEWEKLGELFLAAHAGPLEDRAKFVADVCGDNDALRAELETLLAVSADDRDMEEVISSAAERVLISYRHPEQIGAYRIVGELGSGGMGEVFLGERIDDFKHSVAIKLVRPGLCRSAAMLVRFGAERQMLARLNHPNIAKLLDGGVTGDGIPYLVMEFVAGTRLDDYCRDHLLGLRERLKLFQAICNAVQHAHQNLIVHRDLKPGNILVTDEGLPKLLDFGIAKLLDAENAPMLTQTGDRMLTFDYASPEQVLGLPITTATDVYGLGAVLYELVTERPLFRTEKLSAVEMQKLICHTQPTSPSAVAAQRAGGRFSKWKAAPDLDRIILKALHKVPARRYASAADLSLDLGRYLNGFPVAARPDSFAYRANRFVNRHRFAVGAVALFFVTVIGLSIGLLIQMQRARHEAQSAEAVSQYLVGLFEFTQPDETQGRSVSARQILDRGTERLSASWQGQPLIKARLLNTLGTVYYQLGALDRANKLMGEAQKIYIAQHDEGSDSAADTASTLGMITQDEGSFVRSQQEYERALHILEKKHGPSSVAVAEMFNNLGSLQWTMGNFQVAEKYDRDAIRIDSQAQGVKSRATLTDKANLEALLADWGYYRQAEPLAREVLSERQRQFGPDNVQVAVSLNNLAFLLDRTGRFHEAEPILKQTLEVRKKLYGKEHPEISMSLVSLGWFDREIGDFPEAIRLTQEGLEMESRLQGSESLDTSFDQDALGLVYIDCGDASPARQLVEKALHTRLGKPSPPLPLLSQSYDHLGLIDLAEGKLSAARQNVQLALDMRKRFYGWDNHYVASSFNHLGRVLLAMGDAGGALKAYERGLRIAQQNFGRAPHPDTAEALYGVGVSLLAGGKDTQAVSPLTQSLQMRQALCLPNHPDVLRSERALATARRQAN